MAVGEPPGHGARRCRPLPRTGRVRDRRRATGATLPGFPWFTSDSGFSTPALADLYRERKDRDRGGRRPKPRPRLRGALLAGWSLAGPGGHGPRCNDYPLGGLDCEYNPDQVVQSSPAVGAFLAGGATGIVVGTGTYWPHASETDKLLGFGVHSDLLWQASLDGATLSSPGAGRHPRPWDTGRY